MSITKLATPGVYVDEVSLLPPSVAEVDSAVPAFIGYTEKTTAPDGSTWVNMPVKIYNFQEFEDLFGKAPKLNATNVTVTTAGGNVSAALTTADNHIFYYAIKSFYQNGGGKCYIVCAGDSTSPLTQSELVAAVQAVSEYDEPTMLVCPEAVYLDETGYLAVIQEMINQAAAEGLRDRFAILDVKEDLDTTVPIDNWAAFKGLTLPSNDKRRYAAAYTPYLKTTISYEVDAAVLNTNAAGSEMYQKTKVALEKLTVTLPPSAAIAGVYTNVDNTRGFWKAPANVALSGVSGLTINISHTKQGELNIDPTAGKSINVIRNFPGIGILVWGARTLDGNDNEWRYVNVRRFFMVVEESVKKSLNWAVFEPNTASTWVKVKGMIESYLFQKWRDGALAGAKPEEAYFVRVGLGQTMTPQDVLEGKMYVEIGMAVARPAEFIVLQFMHKLQTS